MDRIAATSPSHSKGFSTSPVPAAEVAGSLSELARMVTLAELAGE